MQDSPVPHELLEGVIRFLRDTALPRLDGRAAYDSRIAASLLATVQRQLARPAARDEAERDSLRALLDSNASDLAVLNGLLCERIESDALALDDPGLVDHLWRVTLDKVAVDQPNYSTYQRVIGR